MNAKSIIIIIAAIAAATTLGVYANGAYAQSAYAEVTAPSQPASQSAAESAAESKAPQEVTEDAAPEYSTQDDMDTIQDHSTGVTDADEYDENGQCLLWYGCEKGPYWLP